MSFEVYNKLCELLFQDEGDDYLFAHDAVLTLDWNLLAQLDNCFGMAVNHVQWSDDSLLFFFGKHKNNQLGKKSEEPWHVYSNPDQPHLYPVLALTKYLFSLPDLLKEEGRLFPGSN
eukprot:9756762-Ditylum_brightwellii.AAC.1